MGIKKDGKDYTLETASGAYPLRMTFKSLDYLDRIYKIEDDGVDFGVGVQLLIAEMTLGNLKAVLHLIRSATLHLASKPSEDEIIDMIGNMTDKDYEGFFKSAQDFLSEAALTKHAARNYLKATKAAAKTSDKKN